MLLSRVPNPCKAEQRMNPVSGENGKKAGSLIRSLLVSLLMIGALLQANVSLAQVNTHQCSNCVAEDVKIAKADFFGIEPPYTSCYKIGDKLNKNAIKLYIDVTAKTRYGLLFIANLYVNDEFVVTLDSCYKQDFPQGPTDRIVYIPAAVASTLKAGDKIELRDAFIAWDNQKVQPKYGSAYNVCAGYNEGTGALECKMYDGSTSTNNGVGLTPKCKWFPSPFEIYVPLKPVITVDEITNVDCHGLSTGAIAISVSPAPPYQTYSYAWSGPDDYSATTQDITGLAAGDYTAVVTLNGISGCSTDSTITVEQNDPISFSKGQEDVDCPGRTNGSAWVYDIAGGSGEGYSATWSLSNFGSTYSTEDTITGLAKGTYYVKVSDDLGCESDVDSVEIDENSTGCPLSQIICSYTQGYFGNEGGKSNYNNGECVTGSSTEDAINASLKWWEDNHTELKVGDIVNITADQVLTYLPGGGPSIKIPGITSLSNVADHNTAVSQILTLGLNIGLNEHLYDLTLGKSLILQSADGACEDAEGYGSYDTLSTEDFDGETVGEIFEAASEALVTGNDLGKYASIAGLLNEAFDECKAVIISDESYEGGGSYSKAAMNRTNLENVQLFRLKAYPNPFSSSVFISFKAPVAGNATVEIMDASGRRIELINKGNVRAGQENVVEYRATQNTPVNLMYRITVGNYSVNGKLVNAKQ